MFYMKFAFVCLLVIAHIPADLSAIEGKREKDYGIDEKTPLLQEDNYASQGVSWKRRTEKDDFLLSIQNHFAVPQHWNLIEKILMCVSVNLCNQSSVIVIG